MINDLGENIEVFRDISVNSNYQLGTSKISEYLGRRIASIVIPLRDNRNTPINYLSNIGRDTYEIETPDSHPTFRLYPPGSFQNQEEKSWRLIIVGDKRWSIEELNKYLDIIVEAVCLFI